MASWFKKDYKIPDDLIGKVVIVTGNCLQKTKTILFLYFFFFPIFISISIGANSGIGYETARDLLVANATVIMACRSSERANEAIETLKKETNKDSITFLQLDTSNLDSVRKYVTAFLEKFDRLDILINNAGMLAKFGETTQSKEGFNMTFATNYLGPFLLTRLLIPVLRKMRSIAYCKRVFLCPQICING